jgi:hypothetical protein
MWARRASQGVQPAGAARVEGMREVGLGVEAGLALVTGEVGGDRQAQRVDDRNRRADRGQELGEEGHNRNAAAVRYPAAGGIAVRPHGRRQMSALTRDARPRCLRAAAAVSAERWAVPCACLRRGRAFV